MESGAYSNERDLITLNERHIVSRSPRETFDIAARLTRLFPVRLVIALHGDLGSGKTCFVQGVAKALGIRQAVTSPTFTLINEYVGTRPLYHIDLYRIRHPDEALAMGLDDYLEAPGVTAIEWAERAGDLIPLDAMHVHLETIDGTRRRRIRMVGASPAIRRWRLRSVQRKSPW